MVRLLLAFALCSLCAAGCADSVKPPARSLPIDPETELTYAPVDGDSGYFRFHFYWSGSDKDGEVVRYYFATDAGTALPVNRWRSTHATDSTLQFQVDPILASKVHVLMVSAVDNSGRYDPTPARRSFTANTVPPTSKIERGPSPFNPIVPTTFTFEWSGSDPDGVDVGRAARVDSFEYLLLQPGKAAEPGHPELVPFNQDVYVDLINRGAGPALAAPFDDWKWTGLRALGKRFQGAAPGEYVFAERAVDLAGATEKALQFGRNIRHFTVAGSGPAPAPAGPRLSVSADILFLPLQAVGPVDKQRKAMEILEGEVIHFSWVASAEAYGGRIVGYTHALDDISAFPNPDPGHVGATYTRAQLTTGIHTLYVRAVDDGGLVTNAVIPILVIHPVFKDPGAPREILYVDDSMSPGNQLTRIWNYPSDTEETNWWTLNLLPTLGVPYAEWDTYLAGMEGVEGRKTPELRDLARYSTVIWNVDFNNGVSSPTGLFKTLVGRDTSPLASYLRAGGTLILTGFAIGSNVVEPRSTVYASRTRGTCLSLEAGTPEYDLAYFPRVYMGVDGALPGDQGLRTLGGRTSSRPTRPSRVPRPDTTRPGSTAAHWAAGPSGSLIRAPGIQTSTGCPACPRWMGGSWLEILAARLPYRSDRRISHCRSPNPSSSTTAPTREWMRREARRRGRGWWWGSGCRLTPCRSPRINRTARRSSSTRRYRSAGWSIWPSRSTSWRIKRRSGSSERPLRT